MPGMGPPPPYTQPAQTYGYGSVAPGPTTPAGPYVPGPGPSSYPRQPGPVLYGNQPPAGQQFVTQGGQPYEVVYVKGKPKKKKLGGLKNAAVGEILLVHFSARAYLVLKKLSCSRILVLCFMWS